MGQAHTPMQVQSEKVASSDTATPSGHITGKDVDQLCVWLRHIQKDEVPAPFDKAYAGWPENQIRSHLLAIVDDAVRGGRLSAGQAAAWRGYWGMEGLAKSRQMLAAELEITPVGVYKRRCRAAEVIATLWAPPLSPPSGDAGPVYEVPSPEERTALLHADLYVRDEASPSYLAAIQDLRRDLLSAPLPKKYPGSNKHARRRARGVLRQRLESPTLWMPTRLKTDLDPSAVEGDVIDLIDQVFSLRAQDDPRAAILLQRISSSLAVVEGRLPRSALAKYWYLCARVWGGDEDIRAVRAAAHVERLAGRRSILTVIARDDAAMTLERHGYLSAAETFLGRGIQDLRLVPVEDARHRIEKARLLTRWLAVDAHRLLADPRREDLETALQRAKIIWDLLERFGDEYVGIYRLVAARRMIQLLASEALRDRRWEGYRKGLALPESFRQYMEIGERELEEASRPEGWKLSWLAMRMGVELERNDVDAFVDAADRFIGIVATSKELHENLLYRFIRLTRRASMKKERRWRSMSLAPTTIPDLPPESAVAGMPTSIIRLVRPDFL
jgi:hypothetical protein